MPPVDWCISQLDKQIKQKIDTIVEDQVDSKLD